MCSTPKGGSSSKPLLSSKVESSFGDMSSSEYSDMVHRANESYEHRQQELKEYRKTHKSKLSQNNHKPEAISFFDKIKAIFTNNAPSKPSELPLQSK